MPYPDANAYGQTTPETALDPQRNAGPTGAIGNAHTVRATANDASMIGEPMPPYAFDTYTPDSYGKEIVGAGWQASVFGSLGNQGGLVVHGGLVYGSVAVPSLPTVAELDLDIGPITGSPLLRLVAEEDGAAAPWAGGHLISTEISGGGLTAELVGNLSLNASQLNTFDVLALFTELFGSIGAGTWALNLAIIDNSSPSGEFAFVNPPSAGLTGALRLKF